jgi:hypothetical protein
MMKSYLLAYKGGAMAPTEEEQQRAMAAWGAWFGSLGDAVVDAGNPFGDSRSVASDGAVANGGAAALSGYSILAADDIDAAVAQTKGCPILAGGGSVEVYEVYPVM